MRPEFFQMQILLMHKLVMLNIFMIQRKYYFTFLALYYIIPWAVGGFSKNVKKLLAFKCFLTIFSASTTKNCPAQAKNPFLRAGGSQKIFRALFHFMLEGRIVQNVAHFLGSIRYMYDTSSWLFTKDIILQRNSKKFRESLLPKNSNCPCHNVPEVIMRPKVFMAQKFVKNAVVKNQVLGQSPHHQHCLNHPSVY